MLYILAFSFGLNTFISHNSFSFHKIPSAAQEEIGRLDVLVCGQCHTVFHFIEEFQEHRAKEGACSQVSHFRENNDVSIYILCSRPVVKHVFFYEYNICSNNIRG